MVCNTHTYFVRFASHAFLSRKDQSHSLHILASLGDGIVALGNPNASAVKICTRIIDICVYYPSVVEKKHPLITARLDKIAQRNKFKLASYSTK